MWPDKDSTTVIFFYIKNNVFGFLTSKNQTWNINYSVQVAAQSGFQVTMVDLNEDLLNATKGRVSKSLARVAKKKYGENSEEGKKYMDETLGRINSSTNPVETAKTTDLVIEAIVENLDIKKKLFKELDEVAPE